MRRSKAPTTGRLSWRRRHENPAGRSVIAPLTFVATAQEARLSVLASMPVRSSETQSQPMRKLRPLISIVAMAAGFSACSGDPEQMPTSERDIHASQIPDGSAQSGRHPYQCTDGQSRFVDFKNEGLTMEVRKSYEGEPLVLNAPAQGFQYRSANLSAHFRDTNLVLVTGEGAKVVCERGRKR
jgi:hypothetical protein